MSDHSPAACHCHFAESPGHAAAWMETVTLLLVATFLAFSFVSHRLTAFLTPAYVWLTPSAAVALYAMSLARLAACFRGRGHVAGTLRVPPAADVTRSVPATSEAHHAWHLPLWLCVVVLLAPIVMALWVNPQQLSAEGARKRRVPTPPRPVVSKNLEQAFNWVLGLAAANQEGAPPAASLPKNPTVLDLLSAVDEGRAQQIEGQFVTMVGQCDLRGQPSSGAPPEGERFDLYRLVVTCCIADATSVSVEVTPTANVKIEAGGWVSLSGIIKFDSGSDPSVPVVHATTIQKIAEPQKPYL